MAGNQNGLQDGRSLRFYDMVRVIRYLQTFQRRPPGYIVENVPVVSSSRSRTLESMHKIHGILGVPVLIDAAAVGSRAHVQLGAGRVIAIGHWSHQTVGCLCE
jgi:site-specific DNA-cytosine methylase